ncbi:MAG TPA: hypothetical protein PK156_48810 [Polyangium sp.]|nr:hypothetical protein [Polyangium sp.]
MHTRRRAWSAVVGACVLATTTSALAQEPQAADTKAKATEVPKAASTPAPAATSEAPKKDSENDSEVVKPKGEVARPPPLHVEYVQYGVAIVFENDINPGAVCSSAESAPCILGGAGGLAIRGGYRSAGPWYIGGAYQFAKMDSSNLYRLGILQQLRLEMRYLPDLGARTAPYGSWGIGALAYGNEWGAETGGGLLFGGLGVEIEVSRTAVIGFGAVYRAMLIAGWKDSAQTLRETGVAQFWGAEFQFELRSEIGRK